MRRGTERTRRGVTLLELLLVMTILSLVLGAGAGVFASLDFGKRQARGFVKNVLRSAQNSAIARQAPARVRIDRLRGVITAESMEVVGTWRFEGQGIEGARGMGGEVAGDTLFVEDGYIGEALYLGPRTGTMAEIPVQLDPAFDFRDGFAIECVLRREGPTGGEAIDVGGVAGVDVGNDGRVRGWFIPRIEDEGRPQPGARVLIESEPGFAAIGEWVRVELRYDREELELLLDGLPVAARGETAAVWRLERPLRLSSRNFPYHGAIDDLVIACVVAGDTQPLPDTVSFSSDTPETIWFAAGGGLDRERHAGPEIVTLVFEDGHREPIFVGAYGTVDG